MPKRVIDFDAMWGSDKLASCAEWAQAEYAWLYGLADASGCFELTNLRVIWGRVAAIRRNLSIERLEQIFHEFHDKGLMFVWEENGKRYGHWTGSDVPGRLPAPSWRIRLERLAPPVPKQRYAEFMSRFSRGRAASPGGGFFCEPLPGADERGSSPPGIKTPEDHGSDLSRLKARPTKVESFSRDAFSVKAQAGVEGLNDGLEGAQAQDWKWNQNRVQSQKREGFEEGKSKEQLYLPNLNSKAEIQQQESASSPAAPPEPKQSARAVAAAGVTPAPSDYFRSSGNSFREREKSLAVARELMVGQGPRCGPVRVKPEALARSRAREGSRPP